MLGRMAALRYSQKNFLKILIMNWQALFHRCFDEPVNFYRGLLLPVGSLLP